MSIEYRHADTKKSTFSSITIIIDSARCCNISVNYFHGRYFRVSIVKMSVCVFQYLLIKVLKC